MPIEPEKRANDTCNWRKIREYVMARAGWRCEHPGCVARQYDVGYWRDGRFISYIYRPKSYAKAKQLADEERYRRYYAERDPVNVIVIVLQVAHMNQQLDDFDVTNLRALCQRHYLAHDHHRRQRSATARLRRRMAVSDLFEIDA